MTSPSGALLRSSVTGPRDRQAAVMLPAAIFGTFSSISTGSPEGSLAISRAAAQATRKGGRLEPSS
jgi:hypothetical protein